MDKRKRDRHVNVFWHPPSGQILLFPYVWFMAGVGAPAGAAIELSKPTPALLGRQILKLLCAARNTNIVSLKRQYMARLRSHWRHHRLEPPEPPPSWQRLVANHPALSKGPGTFLRRFKLCEVHERDGLRHRMIVKMEQSKHRGAMTDGVSQRIALSAEPKQLGESILELLNRDD
jgi:hypothetical protein